MSKILNLCITEGVFAGQVGVSGRLRIHPRFVSEGGRHRSVMVRWFEGNGRGPVAVRTIQTMAQSDSGLGKGPAVDCNV